MHCIVAVLVLRLKIAGLLLLDRFTIAEVDE